MRQCKRHVQARFQRVRPDHQWTFENPRRHDASKYARVQQTFS